MLRRIDTQLREVAQLQELYKATVDTPKVLQKLQQGVLAGKPLSCTIPGLNVTIEFPRGYPDAEPLSVALTLDNSNGNSVQSQIDAFIAAFIGSPSGYAADVVQYMYDIAESLPEEGESPAETRVKIVQFNHLLKGSEHKKEKDMFSAGKSSGLIGGMAYGTPGYVVAIAADDGDDIVGSYLRECRSIGKRGEIIHEGKYFPPINNSTRKEGFFEITIEDVEKAVGGADNFRTIRMS